MARRADTILIEDDNPSHATYSPSSAWVRRKSPDYHGRSYHASSAPGAFVTFTFDGSYVAYYCDTTPVGGRFTVSLDGEAVFSGNLYSDPPIRQKLQFEAPVVPGRHRLRVSNNLGQPGSVLGVDYFAYVPLTQTTSVTLGTTSATAPAASEFPLRAHSRPGLTDIEQFAIIGAVVVVGCALIVASLASIFVRRRASHTRRVSLALGPGVVIPFVLPETLPPPYGIARPAPTKRSLWEQIAK